MAPRKRFLLRIDERLYAALERWAAQDLRSVNGQIEYLLTEAARRNGRLGASGAPEPEPGQGARPQGASAEAELPETEEEGSDLSGVHGRDRGVSLDESGGEV